RGGRLIVQDPGDVPFPSMPRRVIAVDDPDAILPLRQIPDAVVDAVRAVASEPGEDLTGREDELEREFAAFDLTRVGADGLTASPLGDNTLESALGAALQALEERASLGRSLARRLRERGLERSAARYDHAVEEAERHVRVIR